MLRLPVLLELHWNKKMNGENVWVALQNLTKESKYYWNCFSCGGYMHETLDEFLKRVFKQSKSQFNAVCKSCKSVGSIKSDEEYLSSIVISRDLKEYLSLHRDLQFNTVVFKCPVCGKYKYSTKTTMFFKYKSLICSDCISLESKKILTNKTMDLLFPGVGEYWGKNFLSYNKTVPIIYKQQFNLICPVCGKNHSKSYSAIERSGVMCEQCARSKSRVRNVGSLFDNYPVLAEMWDRGDNLKSSKEIPPSSTMVGKFVCIEGGVPHSFVRQVSVMRSSFDKGSNGCPICANRELYTGINDFATKFPKAVGYWDYNNNEFPPEKSLVTNQTKFAMICPRCGKKHTKRSDGVERNGAYCEKCAAVKNKLSEDNSLFTNYPVVAKMWDNGENSIKSKELTVSSQVTGNFMCPGGKYPGKPHVFIRSVANVVNSIKNGSEYNGCSVCAGFAVATGVNGFKTMCPNLSKLWDYSRNIYEPEDVYYLSEKKYSFICPHGHTYSKDLLHMARSEKLGATGCPVCKGKEVRPGVNDIATTHKHIMKYWDYKINDIDPTTVSAGSNKLIKSHCRFCGDVYETSVFNWVNGLVVACHNCRKRQYSAAEKELCEEIRSWGIEVQENVHLTGDGRTYDVYIPSKKIAVEYNGLYYHSDAVRPDKDLHF